MREGWREGGREKEKGKEDGREGEREGRKKRGREGGKEGMKERGRRDGGKGSEVQTRRMETQCVRENRCHSRGGEDSNTCTHSPQIIAGIKTLSSAQIRKKVKTHKIYMYHQKTQKKKSKTVYKDVWM